MNSLDKRMRNTLFKYSKSLGMMEKLYTDIPASTIEEWSDTKDQALIAHYLCELASSYSNRDALLEKIKEIDTYVNALDNAFGHLRQSYPEEFI